MPSLSTILSTTAILIFLTLTSIFFLHSQLLHLTGRIVGAHLRSKTQSRREILLEQVKEGVAARDKSSKSTDQEEEEGAGEEKKRKKSEDLDTDWEKVEGRTQEYAGDAAQGQQAQSREDLPTPDPTWKGIIGFFHPFCNAGGGGERVLWGAIRAIQQKWPNALCVVYTGDHDVSKEQMLERVEKSFNIRLHPATVTFLYLSTRRYVVSSTWPHFTLLGQSLGSLILAYDAFSLLVPDVFIDTMGYAFALSFGKLLFPDVPTAAYVHYPTISTDMLGSLDAPNSGNTRGLNASSGSGWKGAAKKHYWRLFARLYSHVGSSIDVVMTNSSWTQSHIRTLWGPSRPSSASPIEVVFPPVAVEEISNHITIDSASEAEREPCLIYIAQFRPEKNHQLILSSFARFLKTYQQQQQHPKATTAPFPSQSSQQKNQNQNPHLLLIGSVRDTSDEKTIYSLRLLAHELQITEHVTFLLNAPWPTILSRLRTSSVGVNAMWNEHFGIGVVEYQAAGLICVVNDSGGPKMDIVREEDETGWRASGEEEYARAFGEAVGVVLEGKVGGGGGGGDDDDDDDGKGQKKIIAMRQRARVSAGRFGEEAFERKWIELVEKLVDVCRRRRS